MDNLFEICTRQADQYRSSEIRLVTSYMEDRTLYSIVVTFELVELCYWLGLYELYYR